MTALVTFVHEDRAYIATDGAGTVYQRLVSLEPKTSFFPPLNVAIVVRGSLVSARWIRGRVGNMSSFEEMKDELPKMLKASFKYLSYMPHSWQWDVGIVGFHDAPFMGSIASIDRPGQPRFTLRFDDGLRFSPTPSGKLVNRAWERINHEDVTEGVVELLDAQRAMGDPEGTGAMVGGYAVLSSVGSDGFRSHLLKPYPDRRGKKIDPSTGLTALRKPRGLLSSSWRV